MRHPVFKPRQSRFETAAQGKRLREALYVRGDGTLCYYFDMVRALP